MGPSSNSVSRILTHTNRQTTHIIEDNYTDPWTASETIILQGGFGRHAAFWYHWVPVLARNYRVIRRDTRGHGKSSVPKPGDNYDYSLDSILDEIIDTLDQLKVPKVHFLGESTSGMLGMALAARHPDRLHSLIICSSPTCLPPPALEMFAFGYKTWPEACRELGASGWGEKLSAIPGTLSHADPAYVHWWKTQLGVNTGEGLAGYAEFLSSLDAKHFLPKISMPMLILAPARSAATKLEEQKEISATVPNAKLVIIYGQGHEIYGDMAEECQAAVLQFIAEIEKV